MTRRVVLVAILWGLASRPLLGDDVPSWLTVSQDAARWPLLNSAFDYPPDTAFADATAGWAQQAAYQESASMPAALDETPFAGEALCADGYEQGLRPVYDCGCEVCLDKWCGCTLFCGSVSEGGSHPCQGLQGNCYLTEDGQWLSNDVPCDIWGPPVYGPNAALRLGSWGIATDGSQVKTGEYQHLEGSPFWDVDTIHSDGVRTWDLVLSGFDDEANDARIRYYSPAWSGKLDFQRYFRRLDHDPLAGFDLNGPVPPGADDNVVTQDLNVGQDYAIRVQELDAKVQGRFSKNLSWRVNVWSQRKFGERQVNATAHCFRVDGAAGDTCHVLSQNQTIDWLTVEVQPVVEAKFKNVTVEYSHTVRSFGQDDGVVTRQYTRFGFSPVNNVLGPDFQYALVPENLTQIDRLKVNARLNHSNKLYANLYIGDTKNEFRETHRDFGGYDLRLINDAYDDLTLTAYTSMYEEKNELPPFFLDEPPLAPADTYDQDSVRHPIDYRRTRAGLKSSWQPFGDRGMRYSNYGLWDGTSLASGYEYYQLERDFVTYDTSPEPFTQPNTTSHQFEFGPSTRWSRRLDTYVRYKVRFIEDPLIGVSERAIDEPDVQGTFNSNQPEQIHFTEIGGTWSLASNLIATAQFTFVNSWHQSEFANFTEDDYPMVFTVWYAPTHRLSFTGAYAYYSNWIDQDITLGANRDDPTETETTRWSYGGENNLVSLGANYALTPCVQLVGGYEWNRGSNVFSVPQSPVGADWSLLPLLSDVIVETNRVTAGFDWQPYHDMNVFTRYVLFDYDDISDGLTSGTAHMVLVGATRTW